jgi:hypothetical protein
MCDATPRLSPALTPQLSPAYRLNVDAVLYCIIGGRKKYTARWNWYTWSVIKESSTTSELSVYYMDAYDGGLTSSGEGELNWRGNPVCNNHGGTGINCYGTPRSGSPNRNPNGGHGCKKNMGTGWSGALHWVMTNS